MWSCKAYRDCIGQNQLPHEFHPASKTLSDAAHPPRISSPNHFQILKETDTTVNVGFINF